MWPREPELLDVYAICSDSNHTEIVYIGVARNVPRRITAHRKGENPPLAEFLRAQKKPLRRLVKILERRVTRDVAFKLEMGWIATTNPKFNKRWANRQTVI